MDKIEVFLEVAKRQSFAAAARALGMSGPAASKQVMLLEEHLGVKLLHRTTRQVMLTDEGTVYFERARLALEELKDAADAIRELRAIPKGSLRISAPQSFAHMHLLPVIASFAHKYPDLRMDVSLDDRMNDILAEGFDIIIRVGTPQDSSFIIRPLAPCSLPLVASPDYLARYGTPTKPESLKQHRMITYSYGTAAAEWRYRDAQGTTGMVRGEGVFRANTAEMMREAALEGIGMAVLPIFAVAPQLAAGQLVRVLPHYRTDPERQIVALMPPNRYRSTKVKLFLDWLSDACKAMPFDA